MLNYDLSPFYRSTVGFDRLLSMLDKAVGSEQSAPAYPPYNIERAARTLIGSRSRSPASATNELTVETRENTLTVRGSKQAGAKDEKREVLYQGIAARAFERRFQLADHVVATGATSENGLLHIDLVREIPEAQKPRTIAINSRKMKARRSRPRLRSRPLELAPSRRAPERGALFLAYSSGLTGMSFTFDLSPGFPAG